MKKTALILLCAAAAASGCAKKQEVKETAVNVRALTLTGAHIKNGARFSGVIAAEKDVALSFLSAGEVTAVNVRDGDQVRAGQLLAVIDSADAQSLYNAARAVLNQADDAWNRYRPLHVSGNMAEIDWQKVVAERQKAQSSYEIAKKTLDNCNLTAPDSGFISGRKIERGDTVAPGIVVMRLLSLDKLYADISAPIEDARHIKAGTPAIVRTRGAISGESRVNLRGEVDSIDVAADVLTRTYRVRVLIDQPPEGILPGMLCDVYVLEDHEAGASDEMVIPPEALQLGVDGDYFVYVIEQDDEESRAYRRPVETGGFADGGIVILHGIAEGDVVVTSGVQKLDDGVLVNVR